jgi:anti-sigma regulatory factor (Ser/Thr protein kinase)
MDRYVLEIDPDPQLVPTARMFAATVARQLGCAEDTVLDVKIAVSEACTSAVQMQDENSHGSVRLAVTEEDTGLLYEVADATDGSEDMPDEPAAVLEKVLEGEDEQQMRLALIRALFPSAQLGGGSTIRFRVDR